MLKRVILYLCMLAASTASVASPAAATVYYFEPGVLSPQFKSGTCIYRIFYGNYGPVPFAEVRFYAGDCVPVSLLGIAAIGTGQYLYDRFTDGANSDSCGPYFYRQVTFPGPPAYGIGMVLSLRNNQVLHQFRFDGGTRVSPYRYC